MKYVKNFESFKYDRQQKINEEFIFGALKGVLSKIFAGFGSAFKDMANDFKKMFDPEDPNSVKNIILTELKKALDGVKSKIKDKDVDEATIKGIISSISDDLLKLDTGMDKDIDSAIGKDKDAGAKKIAHAILIGLKEAKWPGIVGLLDPNKGKSGIKTNYKYSNVAFGKALEAGKDLISKKTIASKFINDFENDINNQIDKEFTEEEIKKVYDDAMKNAKQGGENEMTYDKVKDLYDKKTDVIYLLKDKTKEDWDKLSDEEKKKPSEKPASDIVGVKKINAINDQDTEESVTFLDKDNHPTIKKGYKQIIGPSEGEKVGGQEDLTKNLKDIKDKNPKGIENIDKISKLYLEPDKNKDKLDQIEKIIGGENAT